MKTLDEVIDIMEHPLYGADDGFVEIAEDDIADALHYLRELQLFRETPVMQGIHKAQEEYATYPVEDWNPPLTWDELREMEGKPVWVEESAENGLWWTYWVIWQGDNAILPKKDYSTKWQAYRKERS